VDKEGKSNELPITRSFYALRAKKEYMCAILKRRQNKHCKKKS